MPQNHLTLTRQTLYELVWSTPMSQLATEFGISDVGLAKRCKLVDVPIPYRGYWARVAAGQTPAKLRLPKYRTREPAPAPSAKPPKEILREGPEPPVHFEQPTDPPVHSEPPTGLDAVRNRLESVKLIPAAFVTDTCAAVRRTAKHHKHPDRTQVRFAAGERTGAIINLNVSSGSTLNRALLLADRLIQTAEAMGWPLVEPPPPEKPPLRPTYGATPVAESTATLVYAQLLVDGERIPFLIEERYRNQPRVPPPAELAKEKREYFYHAPRTISVGTGALRIVRVDSAHYWLPRRRTWYDHRGRLIETKIPLILAAFYACAQEIKIKRAEDERRDREYKEQERLRKDRAERRQAHTDLKEELERQAGAWATARFLRRYIRTARRSIGPKRITASFRNETIDFLDWAANYADQLDPLTSTPVNPEQFTEESTYRRPDEAAFKKYMVRLTSHDGHRPRKLMIDIGQIPNADPDAEDDDDEDDGSDHNDYTCPRYAE